MSATAEPIAPSPSLPRRVLLATGLVLVTAVLPLAFSWQVAATFFAPKLLPLYFGAGLVGLGCLELGGGEDGRTLRLDAADLLALGFIGWGMLACLTASSRWTAVLGLYNQGTGWLFWVACLGMWMGLRRLPWSPRTRAGLLVLITCAGTILGLVVLAQLVRWEPLRFRIGFGPGGRPGGTFGNPLYCGTFLVLALLAALSLLLRRQTMYGRAAVLGAAAVMASALAATYARGAWAAGAAGLAVWALLTVRRAPAARRWAVTGLAVVMVCAVVAVALPSLRRLSAPGPATVVTQPRALGEVSTVSSRLLIWRVALDAIRARPVLGWGPNNYRYAAQQYTTPGRLQREPLSRDADAHDLVLEIAATYGVLGMVLLLLWLAAVVAAALAAGDASWGLPLAFAVLVAFVVASLTMPQNLAVTSVVVVLLAPFTPPLPRRGAARVGPGGHQRRDVFLSRVEVTLSERVAGWTRTLLLVVLLVAVGLGAFFGWRAYVADSHYLRGEIGGSTGELSQAVDLVPSNVYYWTSLGRNQAREGFAAGDSLLVADAVSSLDAALRVAPRDIDALNALTSVALQQGQWARARTLAERAVAGAPAEPQPRANLGYALVKLGEADRGRRQAEAALQLDVPSARVWYTVGLIYRELGDYARAGDLFRRALVMEPRLQAARDALTTLPSG
jgi:tetratricopeptide (TPR) repeat protein